MSITGSLVGYENNNEISNNMKNRSLLNITGSTKPCSSLNSSISNSVITTASSSSALKSHQNHEKLIAYQTIPTSTSRIHLNSLWSIWYGVLATLLQGYLAIQGAHRYLSCSIVRWTNTETPTLEIDLQIILCGLVILLLPLFLTSALFKVGNLANDGVKLATGRGKCSAEPSDGLEKEANGGTLRALWTHGGPTSAFIHIVTALCLLFPRLFLEARLIENGVLSKEQIWRTELDFMVTHRDRLVILSFMTSPYQNVSGFETQNYTYYDQKYYPSSIYENTKLIEKFRPDIDDLEFDNYEKAHENIEMEENETKLNGERFDERGRDREDESDEDDDVDEDDDDDENDDNDDEDEFYRNFATTTPLSKTTLTASQTTSTSTSSTSTKSTSTTTTSTTMMPTTTTIRITEKHITPTIPTLKMMMTTKISAKLKPNSSTTQHQHHSVTENNNGRNGSGVQQQQQQQQQQSGGNGGGGGNKKNIKNNNGNNNNSRNSGNGSSGSGGNNNRNHKKQSHRNRSDESLKGHKKDKHNHRKEYHEGDELEIDDFDDHLELKPQSGLNFETIVEQDASSKVIEFQKPPPAKTRGSKQRNANGAAKSKDSDIHVVKPEKTFEIQSQATTVSANSKIIEIKPTPKNFSTRKSKRFAPEFEINEDDSIVRNIEDIEEDSEESSNYDTASSYLKQNENGEFVVIAPSPLIGTSPGENLTAILETRKLPGIAGLLQRLLDAKEVDANKWMSLPSLEFMNLALAIMVWSVRYPATFWGTSKPFATIFSIQMVVNGFDILLGYAGVSVLYKLQIVGQPLPLQSPTLILNAIVTISLFIFATILIVASSMVLYLYGHGRLVAKIRERSIISIKPVETWIYFAHCASLCFVLALAVVKAPLMHDLSAAYRGSLDGAVLAAALGAVIHLFLWIFMWLGLTAKRRWSFKIPPIELPSTTQPLLMSPRTGRSSCGGHQSKDETIYWPKLTPSSPKLKVTFNEVPSTSAPFDHNAEHDGKRCKARGGTICLSSIAGEADDGDYATLRGPTGDLLHLSNLSGEMEIVGNISQPDPGDDNTSEEGKLLESVRDDSVTYASTRDLEPPAVTKQILGDPKYLASPEALSPLGPVTVTVHSSEIHIQTTTPRCLRRADSGMPNEALTPRSDTTSTESSTSPPERAPSDSSSGVHSGEERDEVVIRPRSSGPYKVITKPPPPAIQEEPFGRSTNMSMSSFKENGSSATLPLIRGSMEPKTEQYCNTMPLPMGSHQQYRPSQQQQQHQQPIYLPSSPKPQLHTTLPNGLRYVSSNNHFLRRMPHLKNAENPYGHLGLDTGHHTFSKLLHDPLHNLGLPPPIPEDRDSANYSMASSENDNTINIQRDIYMHSGQLQIN